MKTKIFYKSLAVVAMATALTGCDENSWNKHLDGFEDQLENPIQQVETVEYTLSTGDYSAIASNATNVALAGEEHAAALRALGTRRAFTNEISAQEYVPAWLQTQFYALDNGSTVQLTYNQAEDLPAELAEAAGATVYTVTEDNYMEAWGSDENYINAFAPSQTPSRIIPGILAEEADPGESTYCVVNYNVSSQEPVFGNVEGGGDTPTWEMSETIAGAASGSSLSAQGVVTAICQQGYILTDKSGSILVYYGKSFDPSTVAIGDQQNVEGSVGVYNHGLQVTGSDATVEAVGKQEVTYPTAKVMSGADCDAALSREGDYTAIYAEISGTASVSGNYVNIILDGAEKAQGSLYQGTAAQKAAFTDGAKVTMKGYFITISGGRYINMVVTEVNGTKVSAPRRGASRAAVVEVPTTTERVLYHYEDGRWSVASGFVTLSPADYTAMGQSYGNLSAPADYLPAYLKQKFPYAQAEAVENVMYLYYSGGATAYACDQYIYDGSAWTLNTGITTVTNQFIKNNGKWIYDPTVYITLPGGRNQSFSATYYQACVDWVYNNIDVPLGSTSIKSGMFYVTSYGNNEYYSGTTAYQNNVDLRPASAREQYAAGYEGMSDEEVVSTMKERFMNQVMPGALSTLHPDATPMDGIDLIYQIEFAYYTGTTFTATARFKVVGKGQFEPVDCTW